MDADEAQTPMLETPAPTYGAVPEAVPEEPAVLAEEGKLLV